MRFKNRSSYVITLKFVTLMTSYFINLYYESCCYYALNDYFIFCPANSRRQRRGNPYQGHSEVSHPYSGSSGSHQHLLSNPFSL